MIDHYPAKVENAEDEINLCKRDIEIGAEVARSICVSSRRVRH